MIFPSLFSCVFGYYYFFCEKNVFFPFDIYPVFGLIKRCFLFFTPFKNFFNFS